VAVETLFKKKKKPSPGRYFFGSFPAPLCLLKIHLHSLVRLRRLLAFPLSLRFFSAVSLQGPRLRQYLAIVASWRYCAPDIQAAMDNAERFHNPLDSDTSRGPEWWFSARCVDEIQDSIALDIPFLNRQCKRVYRSLRSSSICGLIKRRQLRSTTGRMRSALASLLGTQRLSFLYDTLLCKDGSYDADPVVIHRSIQRHYMRHFAVDQDPRGPFNSPRRPGLSRLISPPPWKRRSCSRSSSTRCPAAARQLRVNRGCPTVSFRLPPSLLRRRSLSTCRSSGRHRLPRTSGKEFC
jgi:hypothetical protein